MNANESNSGRSYVGHSYIKGSIYLDDRLIYKSSSGSDPTLPLSSSMYGHVWCVYKISGQKNSVHVSIHTDKYFLSHTHYFYFFVQTTTLAVLDPSISGSDYIPDCI